MPITAESWSTQQLVEFVALISESTDEQDAAQRAVERAADALEAEVCALVLDGAVPASIGFPPGEAPVAELLEAAQGRPERLELAELGQLWSISAMLESGSDGAMIVARMGEEAFTQEESDLLRGMARSLALTLRMLRTLHHERELRRRSQHEVRQRKRVERELAHQSLHDSLTALPNRTLLRDRVAHALLRSAGSSALVAALLIDIDHFKVTNDALGSTLADELLAKLAQRLQLALMLQSEPQRGYTLARVGGDEFVVLCEELAEEHDAITVAERVQNALRVPFEIGTREISLTASIGIAVAVAVGGASVDDDGAARADDMLRDADVAMSRAKERGRDCYEVFDEQMRVRLLDRVALEADLRAALDRNELTLAYQPVMNVEDGSMVAVEALVRWDHPSRGMLPPADFISVAEESDLIVALGEWVIREACSQLRRWREASRAGAGVRVSVNVSARQLTPALIDFLATTMSSTGVAPEQLALEITESLLIEQAESSGGILTGLKALGVGIVLDDFGTGYSSLSYLKSFPLDQLKLDRSFISELADDPRSAKIVSATIEMARALGMTVVAEGVETAEQLEVLRGLRCDYAQGFHFARPEPAHAILRRVGEALHRDLESASPPLRRERARTAQTDPGASDDRELERRAGIGRLAGLLFIVGGLLGIPSNLMLKPAVSPMLIAGLALLALTIGGLCLAIPWRRLSARALHVLAVASICEVCFAVWAVGSHASVTSWYYVLVAAAIAYAFRGRTVLFAYVVALAGAIALPLIYAAHSAGDAAPRTLVGVGVIAATVGLVAVLRERLESGQAELRDLAVRDPLTGIGNYRLLHERLEYELKRHQRARRKLAVLLIDLDRFKQVNESLGHAAGDDVLRRVARALAGAVRQQDTIARQGGDEFAVLAPETDADGAAILAARIRERVARVQFAGEAIGATVGISVFPDDGLSPALLLARADGRLLVDKASSRTSSSTRGTAAIPLSGLRETISV